MTGKPSPLVPDARGGLHWGREARFEVRGSEWHLAEGADSGETMLVLADTAGTIWDRHTGPRISGLLWSYLIEELVTALDGGKHLDGVVREAIRQADYRRNW